MKKLVVFFTVIIIAISSCHKKTMPTITSRVREPLPPVTPVTDVKPDMERGKTIFTTRCSRCHDLPEPTQYTSQRWDGILSSMIPRARLNQEQAIHLTAYLKVQAKK